SPDCGRCTTISAWPPRRRASPVAWAPIPPRWRTRRNRGTRDATPADRHFIAAEGGYPERPAAYAAADRVPGSPCDRARHGGVYGGAARSTAGWRVRGGREGSDQYAQRHASRRSLPLLLDDEPRAETGRRAVVADRRGAAGVVLPAGGEAGLPASGGWL